MGPSPHFGGNPDEGIHQPSYSRTVANRHRLWRRALALRFADPKVWMSLRYMPRWPPAAIKSSESTLPLCRGCQRVARGANGAADEAEAVGWKRKPIRAGGEVDCRPPITPLATLGPPRRRREGCGHDGQRKSVAHIPTAPTTATDRLPCSVISGDRDGRVSN